MDLTRAELEQEVTVYKDYSRKNLPKKYKNPDNEKDFNIGLGIAFAHSLTVKPIYDRNNNLVGWEGIQLK